MAGNERNKVSPNLDLVNFYSSIMSACIDRANSRTLTDEEKLEEGSQIAAIMIQLTHWTLSYGDYNFTHDEKIIIKYRQFFEDLIAKTGATPSIYGTGERTVYSVFNEVVGTLPDNLAAAILHTASFEESKQNPNQELINYYNIVCKALWSKKHKFYALTDKEIKELSNQLSPICKQINFVDYPEAQKIIEQYRPFFDKLINKHNLKSD